MRGIILGGGTFLGYWMKRKLTLEFGYSPIILDLPRKNTRLYVGANEKFYHLSDIDFKKLEDHRPEYVVLNFYDLFDIHSIDINNDSNNMIMSVINKIIELVQNLNCKLLILTHSNRYKSTINHYQAMFNNFNGIYLQYIEAVAKAKLVNVQIVLLPNVFGPRESKKAIISTIFTKIKNQEDIELTETKRDFIYIDSVVNSCFTFFIEKSDYKKIYFNYSSGKKTSLMELYNLICNVLEVNPNTINELKEPYSLEAANVDRGLTENIIIEQDYLVLLNKYKSIYK